MPAPGGAGVGHAAQHLDELVVAVGEVAGGVDGRKVDAAGRPGRRAGPDTLSKSFEDHDGP